MASFVKKIKQSRSLVVYLVALSKELSLIQKLSILTFNTDVWNGRSYCYVGIGRME